MKMIEMPLSELKKSPYNPRKDLQPGDPEFEAIKRSIETFGLVEPLVWNKRSGQIVGGHQREKVLECLGIKKVQVSVVDLDDREEKALNLALNKIGGTWDYPKLKDLLVDLDTGAFDLLLTGFGEAELKKLIDYDGTSGRSDADTLPPIPKSPITKPGDLWRLGKHRLLCGDATDKSLVGRLMASAQAEMVWTDPPYGVAVGDKNKWLNSIAPSNRVEENMVGDVMDEAGIKSLLSESFDLAIQICKAGAAWYVAAPPGPLHLIFGSILKERGIWRQTLQWVKNNSTFSPMGVDYHWQAEPIFYGWLPNGAHRFRGGRQQTTVWQIDRPMKSPDHPTMKPVALVEQAIINSSDKGDLVYDPFLGSGTTLIAAEKHGRLGYGLEIDPVYCDVAVKRWELFTGKKATRAAR